MRMKYCSFHKVKPALVFTVCFFQEEESGDGFRKAEDAVLATRKSVHRFSTSDILSDG